MRRVSGIVLYVIAGFFFYGASLFGFVNAPTPGAKWGIMAVFAAVAILALVGGLALGRFRTWRKDAGIVLLCASGFTAFVAFTLACLFLTEEFRQLMRPDTLTFFNDYATGVVVVVAFAGAGWLLLRTGANSAEHHMPRAASNGGAPPK
jgi:hypothetical protein